MCDLQLDKPTRVQLRSRLSQAFLGAQGQDIARKETINAGIISITCEFVYYTLLVDQGRLFFCDFQMIGDLFACKHGL